MNYLMVAYDYDSNAILAEPLKNRLAMELLRGYTAIHATLVARGLRPQLQCLDNEAPGILKQFFVKIPIFVAFSNAMNPREIIPVPSLRRDAVPGLHARSRSASLSLQRSGQT